MSLLPEGIDDLDPNLRWIVEESLRLIEDVVCGPQDSGTGAPGMEEAEGATIADDMRAAAWKWWQDYPERKLLTELFQRTAQRREGRGYSDSGRPTSYSEGLRVARGLLVDTPDMGRFDADPESAAVSELLADKWVSLSGKRRPTALQDYIEQSVSNRTYYDALGRIGEKLHGRGEDIPRPLAGWLAKAAGGLRRRPAKNPVPSGHPVNTAYFVRDIHLQFAIEVLRRVGVKPSGSFASGCLMVSEAVGLSEDTVRRIWKECPWRTSFVPAMRKYSKAIAERTGPFLPPKT